MTSHTAPGNRDRCFMMRVYLNKIRMRGQEGPADQAQGRIHPFALSHTKAGCSQSSLLIPKSEVRRDGNQSLHRAGVRQRCLLTPEYGGRVPECDTPRSTVRL